MTGLSITTVRPESALASVTIDDRPPSDIWSELASSDGFQNALIAAVRDLIPNEAHPGQYAGILYEIGVTALDGGFASVLSSLTRNPGLNYEDEGDACLDPYDLHQQALDVTASFGQSGTTCVSLPAPDLSEISSGPLPVFEAWSETPTIAVRISESFRNRRADQRRTICQMVAHLASAVDVRVVGTTLDHHWLARKHRSDLPGSVREQCNAGHDGESVDDVVAAARMALGDDGRGVQLLRSVADEPSEVLTYHELAAGTQVGKTRVRQVVNGGDESLVGLGLLEKFDAHGEVAFELTQAGRAFVDALDASVGRQATLDSGVSEPPKACDNAVLSSASGDRTPDGLVRTALMKRWERIAATTSAPEQGIGVVDCPIAPKNNRYEPEWAYEAEAERLVVSAEFDNPLAYWVRIALALASGRTWDHVLTPSRLDGAAGDLDGLLVADPTILRDTRCLGYLADRDASGEAYVDALRDAADELRQMTTELGNGNYEDESRFRGEILQEAHGIAGTIVHLLDLVGVDVVRECRVPTRFTRNYDERRKADFVKTIVHGATIQSRYGHYSAYRQLFEKRQSKREGAMEPVVDADDPFGELIGSILIVGDGVSELAPALRSRLSTPSDEHDDAPDFGVAVPVRTTTSREETAETVTKMANAKDRCPTREAVSVLDAFVETPYDVAAALNALDDPDEHRDLSLADVCSVLAVHDEQRLVPSATPSERSILKTLLSVEKPLIQSELCDRAGVSTQSFRNHRDHLQMLDLIRETCDGWRINLPYDDAVGRTPLRPWYVAQETSAGAVIHEIVADHYTDRDSRGPIQTALTSSAVVVELLGIVEWLDRWLSVVESLCGDGGKADGSVVVVGDSPEQTSIQTPGETPEVSV